MTSVPRVPHRDDKEAGRATSVAAKAIKASVLVYTASPLVNGNTDFADFLNFDKTPLISQTYDKNKWKTALRLAQPEGSHLFRRHPRWAQRQFRTYYGRM